MGGGAYAARSIVDVTFRIPPDFTELWSICVLGKRADKSTREGAPKHQFVDVPEPSQMVVLAGHKNLSLS